MNMQSCLCPWPQQRPCHPGSHTNDAAVMLLTLYTSATKAATLIRVGIPFILFPGPSWNTRLQLSGPGNWSSTGTASDQSLSGIFLGDHVGREPIKAVRTSCGALQIPPFLSMPHSRLALALSWSLLSVTLSQGVLISNVADIPRIKFDFIIIGGKKVSLTRVVVCAYSPPT